MLLHLRDVLDADGVRRLRELLADAPWADGRATAGVQSARAKQNEQLPHDCEAARAGRQVVLAALNGHDLFFSAAFFLKLDQPVVSALIGALE